MKRNLAIVLGLIVLLLPALNVGAQAAKTGTLSYFSWADYPQELFDKFKAQTGWTITYQQWASDGYEQAVKTRLAGGGDLDVFGVRAEMRKELLNSKYLVDLTSQPFIKNVKDLSAATASDGKIFGIVLGSFCEGVWYNKDIFSKQNVAVPKNWQQLNDVSAKLAKAGITPLVEPFKDQWANYYAGFGPVQRLYENDPKLVQKLNAGQVKWTDKLFVDALKEVQAFLKKSYFASESTGLAYVQGEQAFIQGKAAMFIMGTWSMKDDEVGAARKNFNLGYMPMPYNLPGEPLKGIRIAGLITSVSATSKNKDVALKFLQFMVDPNGGSGIYHNFNKHPSNVKGFITDLGPVGDVIKEAQELAGVESIRDDLPSIVTNALYLGFSEMVAGAKTAEQVAQDLADAQAKANM
jgi:raffinose/stachyose/melibiose transport system substrate-binding protein